MAIILYAMREMTRLYNALRKRKNRPHKPLAIMVGSLDTAIELVQISDVETRCIDGDGTSYCAIRKKS